MTRFAVASRATTGLPEAPENPRIRYASAQEIAEIHFGRPLAANTEEIVAVYVPQSRTIVLKSGWDSRNPADVSVLVHELVHHLQRTANSSDFCVEQAEAPAFLAQERWLELFDISLQDAFGIDEFSLAMKTGCLPY